MIIFHELCFFIPGEVVSVKELEDALYHSLREITLRADMLVPAIGEAWKTFQSKKTEENVH